MSRSRCIARSCVVALSLTAIALAGIAFMSGDRMDLAIPEPVQGGGGHAAGAREAAGPSGGWWAEASAALEAMEYRPSLTPGGLQAPNRAQGFRTWFHADRVEVTPRKTQAAPWSWSWSTCAFGREHCATAVAPVQPVPTLARVEYRRPGWSEWYENAESGLEQGFAIAERPAGEGRICIEGAIGGALRGSAGGAGEDEPCGSVTFREAEGEGALRYGGLLAIDARGRELPGEILFAENRVRIVVDDREARYPLLIDPLITTPAWEYPGGQAHALAGRMLSTAGDVNGDGFSDFAIGISSYDGPLGGNQGRVLVFHGAPAGPAATPDWFAEGETDSCSFGAAVSTAGDVNGDGYDDLIVSAPRHDHGDGSQGTVYVFHGSPSGLTGPEWSVRAFPPDTSWAFGLYVALAGDVNGDGFSDVVIGDYHHDGTVPDAGAAWVYHGSPSGLADSPAWVTEGEDETGYYGVAVHTAGDVDADGYDDLLVGAPRYGAADIGRGYLYNGSARGLSSTPSWVQEGTSWGRFGNTVSLAGDVNGDGYGDILVGSLNSAHLYPGSAAGPGEEIWSRVGVEPTTYLGTGLGTAGDVNGDGLADFLVGEPWSMEVGGIGQVDLYYGSRLTISTDPDWVFVSDQAETRLGEMLATAGDVNGDGFSDFLAGASLYSGAFEREGCAYLFLGCGEGPRATPGWVVETNQAGALFGQAMASGGDVNGDGCEEILVGAPGYDLGQVDEGAAFLFLGHGAGPSVLPDWYAESDQAGARLGAAVACAGDINGDGYDDVVVGAPAYDYSVTYPNSGKAFAWCGTPAGAPSGDPANAYWTGQRLQTNAYFGTSVACAGDVDGNGYADLLIGVPGHTRTAAGEGAAVLYLSSATGPPPVPDWVTEGGQANASYGFSVSSAGDVNGDLFSDIAVGAPYFDNGHIDEGAVYLYDGAEGGPAVTPSWTAEGTQTDGHLGWCVAPAGDVNGDSYSDLLVGMPEYLFAAERRGLAMSWYGSAAGLSGGTPADADWRVIGIDDGDQVGFSVASAGDVDGDGYSDVLVAGPHAPWEGVDDCGIVGWERGTPDGIVVVAATIGGAQAGAQFGASVAAADVNGDGFSDVLVGAPLHDQGQVDEGRGFVYYGNRSRGMRRSPDQWRYDQTAPIGLLGISDSYGGFGLRALGRTAAGRDAVWLEWEAQRFGTAFDGRFIFSGSTHDTGIPDPDLGSAVAIQEAAAGYFGPQGWCWRMRIASRNPYFPRTPWLRATGNGAMETDLRTPEPPSAVADAETDSETGALMLSCRPNPFRSDATIAWTQPSAGKARVAVVDLQGRLVRRLVDEVRDAGAHRIVWDGARSDGHPAPAGTYWILVKTGDEQTRARIVRIE